MSYCCYKCGKNFKRKENLDYHLNKQNPCDNDIRVIEPNAKTINANNINNPKNRLITTKMLHEYLNQSKCVYCEKQFSRKDSALYHINHNCKKVKEIENKKQEIILKLK